MSLLSTLCALVSALLVSRVSSFQPNGVGARFGVRNARICKTVLSVATHDIASKYYQLEEMEDRYSTITEVFLHDDNTLEMGETDGPLPAESKGTWEQRDDGSFVLNLSRTFQAGDEKTDMGKFTYTVERTLVGEVTTVGAAVAVSGTAHCKDDTWGDIEVGYFSMIDTNDFRQNVEKNGMVSYAF